MTRWSRKIPEPQEWRGIYVMLLDDVDEAGNRRMVNQYMGEIIKRTNTPYVSYSFPYAWKLLDIDMPHTEWGKDNVIAKGQERTLADTHEAVDAACRNIAAERGEEIVGLDDH